MTTDPEEELIRLIYAAAFDPRLWVDVMERLSEAVGGLRGCLTRIDQATGAGVEAITFRSDPMWLDAYAQHFGDVNVFANLDDPLRKSDWPLTVLTDEDIVDRRRYAQSEFYNDFMRPQDVDRSLFIRLGRQGTEATTINIGRRTSGAFEQADIEFAQRVQPHMVRAHEISQQLGRPLGVARDLSQALQHTPHPLFMVDGEGLLAFANHAGERLLSRDRGLIVINGKLSPSHSETARRFEAMIGKAGRRDAVRTGGSMSLPRPTGRFPLAVRVSPMPLDEGPIHRVNYPVLVSVTDLEADVAAPEDELKTLFSLTGAEARLAAAVFEGLSLPEAAEKFGLSVNTVRFQLARIFEKTGVTRQAELVKLMMRLSGPSLG